MFTLRAVRMVPQHRRVSCSASRDKFHNPADVAQVALGVAYKPLLDALSRIEHKLVSIDNRLAQSCSVKSTYGPDVQMVSPQQAKATASTQLTSDE